MIYSRQAPGLYRLLKNVLCLLILGQLASCTGADNGADHTHPTAASNAEDPTLAGLHLVSPRLHAPAPGQPVSAGYFTLMNHGAEAVTLVGVESTEANVQMHTTQTVDAGTSMRPLDEVVIEPDQQTVFRPGGHHLMIREISSEALAAQSLPVELVLANGSRLPSALDIVPMNEWMQGAGEDHSMH